jgi:membrane protein YdbS with pleckstrin-like domain
MSEGAPLPPSSTGKVEQLAAGIYEGLWKMLATWFDVPRDPPELPRSASTGHYSAFKPSPGYLRYLKMWFWILAIIMDLGLLACWIVILVVQWWVALLLLPVLLIVGIVPDIIGYVVVHLRYDTAWYVMTDRSIRIRRGVWIIQETTITFENVQNVKVQQGPVQRHFGIADVTIETAGAAATAGKHGNITVANKGVIEGIENAAQIRDLILMRLRASQSAGLGDEAHEPVKKKRAALSAEHVAVLREIRSELAAINGA